MTDDAREDLTSHDDSAAVHAEPASVEPSNTEPASAERGADEPAVGKPVRRRRGRLARIGIWSLVTLVTLALVATVTGVWEVRRAFPQYDGALRLAGLSAPVTVYRDKYAIPQLFASNADDLFKAQGYVGRAGTLLGDGFPPARDQWPASRDVRQGPGRHRRVPAHHGLASGSRAGVEHHLPAEPAVPAGLRRRRQRLPQR